MSDAFSFLPEPVNIACPRLNILSIDSNFILLCVFQRWDKFKLSKESKHLLQKGTLSVFIVVIYVSIFFFRTSLEQKLSKFLPFFKSCFTILYASPFDMLNSSNFINYEASRIWSEELSIVWTYSGFFCGFFMLRYFLFQPTISIKPFPFQSTCRLLPCPYYSPLMHFGSCQRCLLYILKVLSLNFCVSSIPSVLFPGLVLKTFMCCDNEAKQPPGKCELHRNKKV